MFSSCSPRHQSNFQSVPIDNTNKTDRPLHQEDQKLQSEKQYLKYNLIYIHNITWSFPGHAWVVCRDFK